MRRWKDVRTLILLLVLGGVGVGTVSVTFDDLTSRYLCASQCMTFSSDSPSIYSQYSSYCSQAGTPRFSYGCQKGGCAGSCDALILIIHNMALSASIPRLSAHYVTGSDIILTWTSPPSQYYTRYLLQMRTYQSWTTLTEIPSTSYTFHNPNPCVTVYFRVIAVNQYGTKGFSSAYPVYAPSPPTAPQNPVLMMGAMFYQPGWKMFAGILQADDIKDWRSEDIEFYEWNNLPIAYCRNINSLVLPILDPVSSKSALNFSRQISPIIDPILPSEAIAGIHHRTGIQISEDGYGCIYTMQVRAVSKCGIPGPYANITVDLTDTSKIRGYTRPIRETPFNPPGVVENVTLSMDLNHPHIWLKVNWQKPTDLGSMGVISHYVMRWGKVTLPMFALNQPTYTHEPLNTTLANNIVEFGIQVQEEPHAIYGFQIMPVAPTQVLKPEVFDMFQVFTIALKNRTSCQNNNVLASRVSCDENGVSVVQFSNTLDISVVWRRPSRRKRKTDDVMEMKNFTTSEEFYEKYAVQLGEVESLPPPIGEQLFNTNVTVLESVCKENVTFGVTGLIRCGPQNDSVVSEEDIVSGGACIGYRLCDPKDDSVVFRDLRADLLYGVRVVGLKRSQDLPTDKEWRLLEFDTFTLNETTEVVNTTSSLAALDDGSDVILVVVGILAVGLSIVLLVLCCVFKRQRRKSLSALDNHLLFGETNPDNPYNQIERAMLTATTLTVVADKWEMPHNCVRIGRVLGSGAFGYVVKGRINRSILRHRGIREPFSAEPKNIYISVAVKLIQEEASETNKEEFLREIRIMKRIGYHKNVISMLGCCTLRDPICLVVEHASDGDLLSHLRNIRKNIQEQHTNAEYVNQDRASVGAHELLSFARQISTGMEFLSQKGFIHRDLAARNILVDQKNVMKIGDFGLTRYTHDNKVYVNRKGGRLPLKWMSVEAINELTFSTASDVWSYGVLLFEIVTLGGTPYPTLDTRDLLRELKRGYRMEKPDNCSEEMYQIMRSCWQEEPHRRPSFGELRDIFDAMLDKSCGEHYINFELDDSKIYYHVQDDLDPISQETRSISPSELNLHCFGDFEEDAEDPKKYDTINYMEDVNSPEKRTSGSDVCSGFTENDTKEVILDPSKSGDVNDVISLHDDRTVSFCGGLLNTSPVRKRIRLGSPHVNKKYATSLSPQTCLNTDKSGHVLQSCRHDEHLSSKSSSSPNLESLPRHSALDFDADESSIGSSCSKCSTSSNGDDDVFYPNSYNDHKKLPNKPYNLVENRKWHLRNSRKEITTTQHPALSLVDDLQHDSGVSTSSVNDFSSQNCKCFVFPPNTSQLLKAEDQNTDTSSPATSDSETKTLSHDHGMSTDTCVWDSDEQTLDTYV